MINITESRTELVSNDNVNRPYHYSNSCSLECIESMIIAFGAEAVYDFCICNAYKYLWRYKNKNGTEDLNKARWYVNTASKLIVDYHLDEEPDDVVNLSKLIDEKLNNVEG